MAENRVPVIGIYGLPGCGKSHLLQQLRRVLNSGEYLMVEGSEAIERLTPGGLPAFKRMTAQQKSVCRTGAIKSIKADCIKNGQAGVVTGHYMFWSDSDNRPFSVCTQADLDTYTHIIYLDTAVEAIAERRRADITRNRPYLPVAQLQHWQEQEKTELRRHCYQNGILFSVIKSDAPDEIEIAVLLQNFRQYTEINNDADALQMLDDMIDTDIKTVLAFDGDRTMAAEDTGTLFWEIMRSHHQTREEGDPFKALFSSPLGYSHTAFRQASLLLEEVDSQTFEEICTKVASKVTLYPEIQSLLQQVGADEHTNAVVITCGIRQIWQKVLEKNDVADKVKVLGNSRISNGIVIDADVKGVLVDHMRYHHNLFVTAFGDSALDLPMLFKANQAVVVVGSQDTRSKSMDAALDSWINTHEGHQVSQALLGPDDTPRLDTERLPVVRLTDPSFIKQIFGRHLEASSSLQVVHLTDTKACKILMTPMRDGTKQGPPLQQAHENTGWYLATNACVDIIGLEEYKIPHVQGGQSSGHRLSREKDTLIVALMRGGEPMARGVNKAFPKAVFLHAKEPEDLKSKHMGSMATVILVDSVINSGKSMIDFARHVHTMDPNVRIVMVTGVIQAQAIEKLEDFQKTLRHGGHISLVALRKSDNKYTGKGSTDTGNRLFNTTYLD